VTAARIHQQAIETLLQAISPTARATQHTVEVLRQGAHPPLRAGQQVVEVLLTPPPTSALQVAQTPVSVLAAPSGPPALQVGQTPLSVLARPTTTPALQTSQLVLSVLVTPQLSRPALTELGGDGYLRGTTQPRSGYLGGDGWVRDPVPHAESRADALVRTAETFFLPATLYPTNAQAAVDPKGWQGGWEVVSGRPRKLGLTAKGGSQTAQSDKRDPGEQAHGLVQLVSDPLAAQTVQGALTLTMAALATPPALGAVFAVHAWVTQGDSAVPRGTILADGIAPLDAVWSAAETAYRASWPVTPLAVQTGDRLVLEIGFLATSPAAGRGTIVYGGTGPDLVADEPTKKRVATIHVGGALPVLADEPTASETWIELPSTAGSAAGSGRRRPPTPCSGR
jgi:hypothetical protein